MKWTDDVADDWDEAAADPPRVDRETVEMTWVDNGFVLAPEDIEDDREKQANAVFSTVACKVGNEPADRDFGPLPPQADSQKA